MRAITLQALLAAGSMLAGASVLAAGSVQVSYVQPEKFADIGMSPRDRDDTLQQLTKHFESLASRHLADGQKLNVEVLDVDLAGTIQPSARVGDGLRVFRDSGDWPRIDLRYTLETAGRPTRSGEQKLSDMNYARNLRGPGAGQPLPAEKRMLEEWFGTQFGPAAAK